MKTPKIKADRTTVDVREVLTEARDWFTGQPAWLMVAHRDMINVNDLVARIDILLSAPEDAGLLAIYNGRLGVSLHEANTLIDTLEARIQELEALVEAAWYEGASSAPNVYPDEEHWKESEAFRALNREGA